MTNEGELKSVTQNIQRTRHVSKTVKSSSFFNSKLSVERKLPNNINEKNEKSIQTVSLNSDLLSSSPNRFTSRTSIHFNKRVKGKLRQTNLRNAPLWALRISPLFCPRLCGASTFLNAKAHLHLRRCSLAERCT